ncbi:hypothetical protein LJ361_13875 [Brucella sp. JSBI001]|nr:hypothetical protein [Brucella sp. JSBI001]UZD68249.1 hypothetical protein LJ361_13875 [Brucella sp. JSBI001]
MLMQPQASRERVIINSTSNQPDDAYAFNQTVALNLPVNAVRHGSGDRVIVSTS